MEIKVGEYIRTTDGRIEKVKVINKYGIVHKHDNDNDTFDTGINWYAESGREINEEDIKLHSKNIIDLIQCGDYVNGYKVAKNNLESAEYGKYVDVYCPSKNLELNFLEHVFPEHIKTILTKEQYEQYSYKL